MDHDFDIDQFLSQPLMAHLATMSRDGARESPMWFLWEDGNLWLVGSSRDSFPRRLRQEPRCAIGIVEFDLASGVLRHVGIRGVAAVLPLEKARLRRLLSRYLGDDETGWDSRFRHDVVDKLDLMVRVIPEGINRISSNGERSGDEAMSPAGLDARSTATFCGEIAHNGLAGRGQLARVSPF